MKKERLFFAVLTACGILTFASCGESSNAIKDEYDFTFNVNYSGGTNRVEKIKAGNKVSSWKARRTNYNLLGWYNTSECKDGDTFDFLTPINADITVFAKWEEIKPTVYHNVTFDFNYEGAPSNYVLPCEENKIIPENKIPSTARLGYTFDGWFTDKACTSIFRVNSTVITSDITLYAGYTAPELNRDSNGNIIYDNVSFNLTIEGNSYTQNHMKTIVKKFNDEYKGKINVNIFDQTGLEGEDKTLSDREVSLRWNQVTTLNASDNYYDINDALALAGISFDKNNYYQDQILDSYRNGKLHIMPVASLVPTVYYNKALLAKYGYENMPSSYNELYDLVSLMNTSEKLSNNQWVEAISMSEEWDMKEIIVHSMYAQNGLGFYDIDEKGNLFTPWENKKEDALSLIKAIKKMFVGEKAPGKIDGNRKDGCSMLGQIAKGNAFMGLYSTPGNNGYMEKVLGKGENAFGEKSPIGVVPMSSLFNLKDSKDKNKVFVQNYGLGIPTYGPNDLYKISAAGVFADYVNKNALMLANVSDAPLYPASKEITSSNEWNNSTNPLIKYYLKNLASPENLYTYVGHKYEYQILNKVNEGIVMPAIQTVEYTDEDYIAIVNSVVDNVKGYL